MNAAPLALTIVICTRGRLADLTRTLESLAGVPVPSSVRAELLLVENSPLREAAALAASFSHPALPCRYAVEAEPGKSRALNRAVGEAHGEVLLFTDDDVRFPERWIERMLEPIRLGQADAVAGGVRLAPHLLRPWMNHTHRAWLASTADYLSSENPSEMCGANMAVTRRALAMGGPFDEELGPGVTNGGEETLFSWRLRRAGLRIASALDVSVEHHLDSRRLLYSSWVRTAALQGRTRAYLMHHWHHQRASLPGLRHWYFQGKLWLRRAVSHHPRDDDEGIAAWELSYVQDAARWAHFARERRRTPRYPASLSTS